MIAVIGIVYEYDQQQDSAILSKIGTDLAQPDTAGWQTNLAATTCGDYQVTMNATQRQAAAAQLLAIFRHDEVVGSSDGAQFAATFATEINTSCRANYVNAPTTGVIAAATLAYLADASLHPAHH
ncbi:MAG: hypothetical protein ACRDGQ_06655 [Candidatus Limnocylindrales bacterium]